MAMHIDEDEIRRRAYRLWEAEGRPEGRWDEHWRRARAEIEREFRRATEQAGKIEHRMNPPLEVEEALDPNHWRGSDER
jgi:hypothetical protein